ncbi:predicted protein [Postia placenta Mad-698-R]|nr:predicted protein [Postia placenta Mad-698-R]
MAERPRTRRGKERPGTGVRLSSFAGTSDAPCGRTHSQQRARMRDPSPAVGALSVSVDVPDPLGEGVNVVVPLNRSAHNARRRKSVRADPLPTGRRRRRYVLASNLEHPGAEYAQRALGLDAGAQLSLGGSGDVLQPHATARTTPGQSSAGIVRLMHGTRTHTFTPAPHRPLRVKSRGGYFNGSPSRILSRPASQPFTHAARAYRSGGPPALLARRGSIVRHPALSQRDKPRISSPHTRTELHPHTEYDADRRYLYAMPAAA